MTVAEVRPDPRWRWLVPIMVLGLGLRIAAAQGGLWLDEAWSAKLAHDAGTPIGVFLNINHDNNHHLNSLWLQFVGLGAAPVIARALSIVTGTLAIVVAGRIAAPRGPAAAIVAALLFAVSPILVTLGSEARGYAPMMLALLVAILLVDRRLAGGTHRPQRALALCFALGTLSQLTMAFGILAVTGWYGFAMWRRVGLRAATAATLGLFGPAMIAFALALALVFVPALASHTGFQFGSYEAFGLPPFLRAVAEMIAYTLGLPFVAGWPIALVLVALLLARRAGATRLPFYRLAIFAFPGLLALLHAGNVGQARYYLVAGLALLLMLGEMIDTALAARGGRRAAAAAVLGALVVGGLAQDADLIVNQRGDPAAAVRAMRARAPAGTTMILDRDTGLALLESSAAQARYPVIIQRTGCPPRRFLLLDRFRGEDFPAAVLRCGARYVPIDGRRARGLSGTHWTLYERRR